MFTILLYEHDISFERVFNLLSQYLIMYMVFHLKTRRYLLFTIFLLKSNYPKQPVLRRRNFTTQYYGH